MSWPPAFYGTFDPGAVEPIRSIQPLEDLTAEWAWGGSGGRGIKVAVIDSGIDADHPAIGGRVAGYVAITEGSNGIEFDASPHRDLYGHGTACAGIILGLAPECELYSVRVLDGRLAGRGPVFTAAIRWALDNGMHVCNLSLGTTKKDFYAVLHELADQAYFRNVMLVTAANNLPIPSFPSVYASVISVSAHAVQDPRVFYYNPTPPVEFYAWGTNVQVAWIGGGSKTVSGNSFAAPHLAGLVVRMLAKHRGLTVFQVKVILRALAANVVRGPGD